MSLHPNSPPLRLLAVFRGAQMSRWPIWMLIAAWVCANTPQVLLATLLAWMAEARSFSHQERLSVEVACLLTGQPKSITVNPAPNSPAPTPVPVIPIDIFAKRVDLAIEQTGEDLLPRVLRHASVTDSFRLPGSFRAAPPHEPPRLELS